MSNFEQLTNSLMQLMIDQHIGLSLPLRRMVAILAACLLDGIPAHLTALAEALPDVDTPPAVKEQRLRRFFSNSRITPRQFLPGFIHLLRPMLTAMPEIVLSMDRTHWHKRKRHVNILMVSVTVQGRAIPLFWVVWNRAGNSSLEDWKTVLTPVITELQAQEWLRGRPLLVVADRKFASPRLAEWLKTTYQVETILRLKRSEYLCDHAQTVQLAKLLQYFPRGATQSYRHITVTKASTFLVNVTITWGAEYDEPLMLVTTLEDSTRPEKTYPQRFWIEPMFKDQKSNGFDIEQTKMTDAKRIETLLLVTAFAHVFCTSEGYRQETQGDLKKNKFTAPSSAPLACFYSDSKPLNGCSGERVLVDSPRFYTVCSHS